MIELFTIAVIIGAGLSFGSFATLAAYRLPRGEDIVIKPSRCPAREARLTARDLVPLLSWLINKAACRHCHAPVHWRYPAIELCTALAFVLIYAQRGLTLNAIILMTLALGLIILIVVDLEHYMIPDLLHILLLPLAFLYRLPGGGDALLQGALGAGIGGALGLALCYGYRALRGHDGLGLGDVKLLAVAGAWVGPLDLVPFLCLGGILGVLSGILWRIAGRGALFPFGPALAASLFICVLYPAVPQAFWQFQLRLYA